MNDKDFEEFCIGNMKPVVQPDQILSKNETTDECSDDISSGIAKEFDALDMMVPGAPVTESDDDTDDETDKESDKEKETDDASDKSDKEDSEDEESKDTKKSKGSKSSSAYEQAIGKTNKEKIAKAEKKFEKCESIGQEVFKAHEDASEVLSEKYHKEDPEYIEDDGKITGYTSSMLIWSYDTEKVKNDEKLSKTIETMKEELSEKFSSVDKSISVEEKESGETTDILAKIEISDFEQPESEVVEESALITFANDSEFEEMMMEATDKIDEDIKPIIDSLNEKGYKTKYSCSGHPSARFKKDRFRDGVLYDKLYTTARIVFDGKYDITAPKHWEVKTLNDGKDTALYPKAPSFKIVDGLPKDAFYKWKDRYMNGLESWVEKLPKVGEEKSSENEEEKEEDIVESVFTDLYLDV